MSKAADLVKNLGKKQEKAKTDKASYSEWPKCCIAGCPLRATIKDEKPTCTHHHRTHGFEADCITEAVKEFMPYHNKYAEMIHWNVRTWRERENQIMGWPVLPATKFEMDNPTMYLNRLKAFIDSGIRQKAEDIYQGR